MEDERECQVFSLAGHLEAVSLHSPLRTAAAHVKTAQVSIKPHQSLNEERKEMKGRGRGRGQEDVSLSPVVPHKCKIMMLLSPF